MIDESINGKLQGDSQVPDSFQMRSKKYARLRDKVKVENP